ASAVVRNARTFAPVDPALILAVMEKEGYRTGISLQRVGQWADAGVVRADFDTTRNLRRVLARAVWLVFPFGLDILNYANPPGIPPTRPTAAFVAAVNAEFDAVLTRLTTPLVPGNPDSSILDTAKLPTALVRDFLEDALEARWDTAPTSPMVRRVLSRRTQWISIALQAALVEWNHHLISERLANP